MARPQKTNAEYFSHDADMRNDPKVKALRRKFKHTGYAVWNYLLETLTDSDDFSIVWNEVNIELLAGDFDVDTDELIQIVDYCVMVGLLQKEGNSLYSKNHRERFASLMQKRERRRSDFELRTSKTQQFAVMDVQNPQQTYVSDAQNPHSIVKDSIVENSRVENIINPHTNSDELVSPPKGGRTRSKSSLDISVRKKIFVDELSKFLPTYGREMLNDFHDHWTEANDSGTKMLFEYERTWSFPHRLKKWAKNERSPCRSPSGGTMLTYEQMCNAVRGGEPQDNFTKIQNNSAKCWVRK